MLQPITLHADNPGPMTGAGNNTYLIAGSGGDATLIDAGVGMPRHLEAIESALRESGTSLRTMIATHGHMDHVSGAAALAAAYVRLACVKYPWPGQDARVAVEWTPMADGDVLAAGDTELVALHTPGHAPDHCVLWHRESGIAFTGDLIMRGGSVIIPVNRGGDLRQYLASLERLRSLGARTLLPAHGPAISEPAPALEMAIAHRLAREAQVMAALRAGHATASSIAESIYDGLPSALMPAALENVRAHLEKLRYEQRAVEADGHWQV